MQLTSNQARLKDLSGRGDEQVDVEELRVGGVVGRLLTNAAAATSVAAMAHLLPAASSSSICRNHGQARLQNPLCLPRFRRIRRPLKSACGELQTSEPTTVMAASTSIRTHRATVHDRECGVVDESLVPELCCSTKIWTNPATRGSWNICRIES